MTYKTFKRTARNWPEFGTARKYTDRTGLTIEEARQRCKWWNEHRTKAQIRHGTMMEFIHE